MRITAATKTALASLELTYLHDAEQDAIVLPFPVDGRGMSLVFIRSQEKDNEVYIECSLAEVAPSRRQQTAVVLAELNARYKGGVFKMVKGHLAAHVCVDLEHVNDVAACIRTTMTRFLMTLDDAYAEIAGVAYAARKKRRSRLERELEEILSQQSEG